MKTKLLSLLLAFAVTLASIPIVGAAAEPNDGRAAASADDEIVIFEENFDDKTNGAPIDLENGQVDSNYKVLQHGENHTEMSGQGSYGSFKYGNWHKIGWNINEKYQGIKHGKVHITFDFSSSQPTSVYCDSNATGLVGLGQTDVNHETLSLINIMGTKNGGAVVKNDPEDEIKREIYTLGVWSYASTPKVKPDYSVTKDKWYRYDGTVDLDTRAYSFTVAPLDETEKTQKGEARYSISSVPAGGGAANSGQKRWAGWPSAEFVLNSFSVTEMLDIDNIRVSVPDLDKATRDSYVDFVEKFDCDGRNELKEFTNLAGDYEIIPPNDIGKYRVMSENGRLYGNFHSDIATNSRRYGYSFAEGSPVTGGLLRVHFKFRGRSGSTVRVTMGSEVTWDRWLSVLDTDADGSLLMGGHSGDDRFLMKDPAGNTARISAETWYTYDAVLNLDARRITARVTDESGAAVGSCTAEIPTASRSADTQFVDWPVVNDFREIAVLRPMDMDDLSISTCDAIELASTGADASLEFVSNVPSGSGDGVRLAVAQYNEDGSVLLGYDIAEKEQSSGAAAARVRAVIAPEPEAARIKAMVLDMETLEPLKSPVLIKKTESGWNTAVGWETESGLPDGGAEADFADALYAQVSFDGTPNVNITALTPVEGSDVYETRDGVRVLKLGQNGGGPNYMAINVTDGLFPPGEVKHFAITVRYYDEGHGWFGFRYNTVDETPRCDMTDTREWKEHTFYLDDITFENKSARNSDLMLAGWLYNMMALTPEAVYIQWIRIEEVAPREPVELEVASGHTGNIFGGDDPKTFSLNAKNTLEDQAECELSYRVLDYDGNPLSDENTLSFSVAAGETVKNEIAVDVSRYGLYRLETRFKTRGKYRGMEIETDTGEVSYDFSVMNKFKDGEEGNRFLKTNSHHGDFDQLGRPQGDAALEAGLFKEAGLTGDRDEYRWKNVEKTEGVFGLPSMGDIVSPITDNGMDMLMILCYGNSIYTPGYNTEKILPDNSLFPGYEERFLDYVDWITKKFKGKVKYYEVWNEPNGENFNYLKASPEQYAALLKKVYPIIKQNDPDAKVVGMAIANTGADFTRAALNAGAGDYMDVASFHPYVFNSDFSLARYKNTISTVRRIYTQCGYPDMPFLFTEMGVSAWPESGLWPDELHAGAQMVQMYAASQAEQLAEAVYIFQYVNTGPELHWADGTQEQRWGLVNHHNELVPYSAHPGAIATAAYNKLVGNAVGTLNKSLYKSASGYCYAYMFERETDGKDVLVYWSEKDAINLSIGLGAETAEMYDMYSNSEGSVSASDGTFKVEGSPLPRYLVGDFSELTLSAAQ